MKTDTVAGASSPGKVQFIIDPEIKAVNAAGPDMVALDSSSKILTIGEAKNTVASSIPVNNFRNYFAYAPDGQTITAFDMNYILKYTPESALIGSSSPFKDSTVIKQFEVYINGPNSESIRTRLMQNLPSSLPYTFTHEGATYTGTVNINIIAHNL